MIQLTCANCRNQLEVDDAFAGSVCRCQHCGTIQTVPRKGSASARARTPGVAVEAESHAGEEPKALYQVKSRAGMSSHPSGLEELAEVVHSSGLGSGLLNRSSPNLNLAVKKQKKQNQKTLIIAIASAIGLLLIGALIMMLLMNGSKDSNTDNQSATGSTSKISKPAFAGIVLAGDKIMYLIDRGDATADFFPQIKTILLQSAKSLGPERRFSVLLWNNGSDDSFPISGTVYATGEELGKLGNWLDNVSIGRATSIDTALANAIYQSPKEIVILTAKGDQLDDEFAATVSKIRGTKTTALHCVSINSDSDGLKKVARESGGKYLRMSGTDLGAAGEN